MKLEMQVLKVEVEQEIYKHTRQLSNAREDTSDKALIILRTLLPIHLHHRTFPISRPHQGRMFCLAVRHRPKSADTNPEAFDTELWTLKLSVNRPSTLFSRISPVFQPSMDVWKVRCT